MEAAEHARGQAPEDDLAVRDGTKALGRLTA
jgi:hypothetical protein